jgi:soluble lytic murein transglycosylase
MFRRSSLPLIAASLWLGLAPAGSAQSEAEGALVGRAMAAASAGAWLEAERLADETGNAIAADLVLWMRLRDGAGDWPDYGGFLARRSDWPSLAVVRRAGERQMPSGQPPEAVFAWFDGRPPETGVGALRLAEALSTAGRPAEAEAEIVRAWTTFSMTYAERKAMYGRWKSILGPHHQARMDMLLWRGLTAEAEGMMTLVSPAWQKLAAARIATRRDAAGLQYAIDQVPPELREDPGLAFERYLYRLEKRRWQDAEAWLLAHSTSADALGRPEMWMERRANLARQALEDGEVDAAYRLAANNFGAEGADYADAEWVAGFIALTRMDDPERAVGHFERFRAAVTGPISVGRAGYWLGMAHRAAGDEAAAVAAFRDGARFQTSFYGQLAAEAVGVPADATLAGGQVAAEGRDAPAPSASVIAAARLLLAAADEVRAMQFLRHAAAGQPAATRTAVAAVALDLDRPEMAIRIGKDAAADGLILPEPSYPLHPIARRTWRVPTEFAMAIARQESELDATAGSSAGARGLMQLMPATAKDVADRIGLSYEPGRLTQPHYNARLGTEYLAQMLARFDGSALLAAAAYNAGPGRVDQWLERNGDPRRPEVDSVVWIESIPFSETRNYVMRVLEGLHVYRARLEGAPVPLRIAADIGAAEVHVSTRDLDLATERPAETE